MRIHLKVVSVFLIILVVVISNTLSDGYSYWNNSSTELTNTTTSGEWNLPGVTMGPELSKFFEEFIDQEQELDPNSDWGYIETQTDVPANLILTTTNPFHFWGHDWNFWFKGKVENYATIGYISLVDRTEDEFGTPIHDINPAFSETPLYPYYNYYKAFDAWNSETNNLYSLRMNYNVRMTTSTTIGQVSSISFYAMLGLSDPDDPVGMRETQRLYVEVSPDGNTWTKIGKQKPTQAVSTVEAFTHYSYDVPANLLGQDLFVRIRYNGRTLDVNGEILYGRCIIDELEISFL